MSLTDLYIKDRHSGLIHKIGSDRHDSLSVTDNGTVTYYNLQNGDGCIGSDSKLKDKKVFGYEFVTSDCGAPESGAPCPSCGSYMLQPCEKYFFCVECGEWSDKDGNIIPEQRLLDEGLITETRAETEKRLNAIFSPPKTNYRKIIASQETLAEFIAEDRKQCHQANCGAECNGCTKEGVLRWLKQEADPE